MSERNENQLEALGINNTLNGLILHVRSVAETAKTRKQQDRWREVANHLEKAANVNYQSLHEKDR